MQVADTGFHPRRQCPLLVILVPSSCHPSAQTLGSRNFIKLVSIKV
ncbi:hypothetical protein WD_0848 [Wolbachia endosymbiont of Drosophila melanogaster]|nr:MULTISPECIES: hypothetical protein [Wolbachia]MDE5063005.1 hypothetical protein [Wolbachia endosymbiont of Drosophila chauvacae]AAS14532.1 hypothetical protein WD_0848 [Wolbachia endosymbiont of Drosophila melanogaster]MBA8754112.1 hypothetical protein [Wolbachia pipientis]MBA8765893.1 hypothetical protein [Wolbachia pipientis]MCE4149247.1 hypothetical protein [Wolbachia endosymbiont of Drosophila melanogaster]